MAKERVSPSNHRDAEDSISTAQAIADKRMKADRDVVVQVALKVLEVYVSDYLSKPNKPTLRFWLENMGPELRDVTRALVPVVKDLTE